MRLLSMLFASLILVLPVGLSAQKKKAEKKASPMNEKAFKGLKLRGIGPALMSGRIADIAIHPQDQSTWYVGVGSGGVWKTTNAGTIWNPIFDEQGSYSIGCITLDPNRPEVIWVGTGENVGGRHVGYGDGVYRSQNGGKSWKNMGLKDSQHIGTILVDPRDSKVVYVAAQGPLWSAGGERGLYKSIDGGKAWKKILGEGDYTGVNEVRMDPRNPDVLYASTHQRFRNVAALINGGPGSGIHKSTDGGQTWRQLKTGLPKQDMGKIGLAISPQKPDVVYATIELAGKKGGFYRSANGGASWEKRSDYVSGGTGPHYYQEIFASPHKFDRVYHMDVRLHFSEDGGKSFKPVGEKDKHVDNHAMAFDPNDPNYLLVGCDGGLYQSWDLGKNWKYMANLPVTQFYKVAVDYDLPFYNVYGGTQDNNSQGGPSRTDNVSGIRNSDWFITLFADGHQSAVDPTNPDIIYAEWQEGNLVRYDRPSGEFIYIQPQAEVGDPPERFNWDSPILISPHDPARIYFASQRVWRSDNRGDAWQPISTDLTKGQQRLKLPMMGRTWSDEGLWDLTAMSMYGTVTSLSESPLVDGLLYAGTDDGMVQVSENGGQDWVGMEVGTLSGVPKGSFVNDIKADLHDADTVYLVLDHHKSGDFRPFVMKSVNRGKKWSAITGDLPERHLVWRLVQDHVDPNLLFVGTEFGVFFTVTGGTRWIKLSGDVPNIPFRDLVIQKRENDLVGATFGRGFYILDDYSPLRSLNEKTMEQEATLFPIKDALWYIPKRPMGRGAKAAQGSAFFTAPNPPFGAVFTYYLNKGYSTRKAQRQKADKNLVKEGKGTAYPQWEQLQKEAREGKPAIVFTISDEAGNTVRRITGPSKPGFHRIAWDLRYPSQNAWRRGGSQGRGGNSGWLASPGTYWVQMAKRIDGVDSPLGEKLQFQVKPLPGLEHALPIPDTAEVTGFYRKLENVGKALSATRSALAETEERVKAIREVGNRASQWDGQWSMVVADLETRLYHLRDELTGDRLKGRLGEPYQKSISEYLGVASIGNRFSTAGPTATHKRCVEIAVSRLEEAQKQLKAIVAQDLPALEAKLDAAGIPWSPGRPIPNPR